MVAQERSTTPGCEHNPGINGQNIPATAVTAVGMATIIFAALNESGRNRCIQQGVKGVNAYGWVSNRKSMAVKPTSEGGRGKIEREKNEKEQ